LRAINLRSASETLRIDSASGTLQMWTRRRWDFRHKSQFRYNSQFRQKRYGLPPYNDDRRAHLKVSRICGRRRITGINRKFCQTWSKLCRMGRILRCQPHHARRYRQRKPQILTLLACWPASIGATASRKPLAQADLSLLPAKSAQSAAGTGVHYRYGPSASPGAAPDLDKLIGMPARSSRTRQEYREMSPALKDGTTDSSRHAAK
jgi:hypothetical protein